MHDAQLLQPPIAATTADGQFLSRNDPTRSSNEKDGQSTAYDIDKNGRNASDLGLWWAAGDSNPEPED